MEHWKSFRASHHSFSGLISSSPGMWHASPPFRTTTSYETYGTWTPPLPKSDDDGREDGPGTSPATTPSLVSPLTVMRSQSILTPFTQRTGRATVSKTCSPNDCFGTTHLTPKNRPKPSKLGLTMSFALGWTTLSSRLPPRSSTQTEVFGGRKDMAQLLSLPNATPSSSTTTYPHVPPRRLLMLNYRPCWPHFSGWTKIGPLRTHKCTFS